MKNTVYVIVIVVCLSLAAIIGYKYTFSGGGPSGIEAIDPSKMMWVKCNNPSCKAEYQISEKSYYEYAQQNVDPMAMGPPALTCEKCGEKSVFEAVKCPKCGLVFFRNSVPADFADRCPKCKFSQMEHDRKEAAAQRGR
jgi:phage FluMu protein Com